MWSVGGLERLRGAVRARLRAVLESDCPPLEPSVRTVLEQRLDSAVQDLMELIRRGEDPGPGPGPVSARLESMKLEQHQVKQELETSDWSIVCVKVEQEDEEIKFIAEPPSVRPAQVQGLNHNQRPNLQSAENGVYCPQCGSTLSAQGVQRPPSLPPSRVQPQCAICGQTSGRDVLLLEHNYTQDLQSVQGALERGAAGFRCSACGQDFCQVGALLEHMSQHLSLSSTDSHGFDSVDGDNWSYEDEAFDGAPPETTCSVCGYTSINPERLHEHLKTHLG